MYSMHPWFKVPEILDHILEYQAHFKAGPSMIISMALACRTFLGE
jgi:hypothetical protein